MKAAYYGRSIEIRDVPKPVPRTGEVQVRVHAATVCAADYRLRGIFAVLSALRLKKPSILGFEFSGTVEETGEGVTGLQRGDLVFGLSKRFGGHAEYVCAPQSGLAIKPANMTLEEAAAVAFGGFTALDFLRRAKLEAGQHVLVYGASGSCGVYVVQLAKHFGARVTAVCSTANVAMVQSLGADSVVDYTREDFSSRGETYDMVFDTVGFAGYTRSLKVLKRGAPYVLIAPSNGKISSLPRDIVVQAWLKLRGTHFVGAVGRPAESSDLAFIRDLIEAGKLRTVIDRRYPLDQIEEAQNYAAKGHKKGHVIINVERVAA